MATHLDDDGVANIIAKSYPTLRPTLRSGDLLFCSGEYLISRVIRRISKSPWSHVGIILRVDAIDRVLVLESVEDVGVRLAPLSKYCSDYDGGQPYCGKLVIARVDTLTPEAFRKLAAFGTDKLTRPYDKTEIGSIVSRLALGIGRQLNCNDAYICSELVYACFDACGITLHTDGRGFVSPENLWCDDRVLPVARVV